LTTVQRRLGARKLVLAIAAISATFLAAVIVYCLFFIQRMGQQEDEIVGPQAGGALLICGGGPVPPGVRQRFIQWAGGRRATIIVIPSFDAVANKDAGARLLNFWRRQGAEHVDLLSVAHRAECNDSAISRMLAAATGVWLSGGDQAWLSQTYVGTEVERHLKALLDRGGIVGGSSAGAAIMSRVMIANGLDEAMEQQGFDLLRDAVIDQHFLTRNRVQRLLGILSQHPGLIGIGIDERTALQVRVRDMWVSVLGQSYVMTCLPSSGNRPPRIQALKPGDRVPMHVLRDPAGWNAPAMDFEAIMSAQDKRGNP
jgi:cyanophycinase